MRPLVCGSALVALLAGTPAQAETPGAMLRAEACLRLNVAKVAGLDGSLQSAADFLVNYLCAEEVEAASRFQRNSDLIAVLSASSPGAGAKLAVDTQTGRLKAPIEPGKSPTDGIGAINVLQAGFAPTVSPSLKALAGRLILEARKGR